MPWTPEASTLCANPTCAQPKRHGGECDDNAPADTQPDIREGDLVSLAISSEPDDVTGTVKRVYRNVIDVLVADIELPNGETHPQCVKFLTRVRSESAR